MMDRGDIVTPSPKMEGKAILDAMESGNPQLQEWALRQAKAYIPFISAGGLLRLASYLAAITGGSENPELHYEHQCNAVSVLARVAVQLAGDQRGPEALLHLLRTASGGGPLSKYALSMLEDLGATKEERNAIGVVLTGRSMQIEEVLGRLAHYHSGIAVLAVIEAMEGDWRIKNSAPPAIEGMIRANKAAPRFLRHLSLLVSAMQRKPVGIQNLIYDSLARIRQQCVGADSTTAFEKALGRGVQLIELAVGQHQAVRFSEMLSRINAGAPREKDEMLPEKKTIKPPSKQPRRPQAKPQTKRQPAFIKRPF